MRPNGLSMRCRRETPMPTWMKLLGESSTSMRSKRSGSPASVIARIPTAILRPDSARQRCRQSPTRPRLSTQRDRRDCGDRSRYRHPLAVDQRLCINRPDARHDRSHRRGNQKPDGKKYQWRHQSRTRIRARFLGKSFCPSCGLAATR
jgi:hypothetical protein